MKNFNSTSTFIKCVVMSVIDGYATKSITVYTMPGLRPSTGPLIVKPISERTQTTRYLHCNWGWGGVFDGYFANDVFNYHFPTELNAVSKTSSDPYNYYSYSLKIITNIKP